MFVQSAHAGETARSNPLPASCPWDPFSSWAFLRSLHSLRPRPPTENDGGPFWNYSMGKWASDIKMTRKGWENRPAAWDPTEGPTRWKFSHLITTRVLKRNRPLHWTCFSLKSSMSSFYRWFFPAKNEPSDGGNFSSPSFALDESTHFFQSPMPSWRRLGTQTPIPSLLCFKRLSTSSFNWSTGGRQRSSCSDIFVNNGDSKYLYLTHVLISAQCGGSRNGPTTLEDIPRLFISIPLIPHTFNLQCRHGVAGAVRKKGSRAKWLHKMQVVGSWKLRDWQSNEEQLEAKKIKS